MSAVLAPTREQMAAAQESLLRAKSALKAFEDSHRIYFFEPEPDQAAFFAAPENCPHTRVAQGANRSGKTSVGCVEGVSFGLTFRPWLLPGSLKDERVDRLMEMAARDELPAACRTPFKRPTKGLVVVEDWGTSDEIFTEGTPAKPAKFKYWIPPDALARAPETNEQGHIYLYTFKNGSTITIDTAQSYKNNPMSFEGTAWDWIMFDEPKEQGLVSAACRGLVDTRGYQWHTFTPWNIGPWAYDALIVPAASNPDYAVHRLRWEHNRHIDHKGMQSYLDTLPEDEKAARGSGEFVHLMGLVYKEFKAKPYDQGGNILPAKLDPDWIAQHASVTIEIDPHPRQPQTALFMASDDRKRNIVFDEIFRRCLIPDFIGDIKAKLVYWGAADKVVEKVEKSLMEYVTWIGMDPIGFDEDPVDRRKWADEFWEAGLEVQPASKRKEAGIARTNLAFKERELLICGNCVRTIYELQHYVYQEWRDRLSRNEREKPVDKDDHTMECLYRLVIREPKFERAPPRRVIKVKYCP